MNKKEKRGISHVEVIISFALFIGIVSLIFLFLRPVREPSLSNVVLDVVELGLRNETTISLGILPFGITTFPTGVVIGAVDCFTILHPLNIGDGSGGTLKTTNVFVKDASGNDRAFKIEPSTPNLITIERSVDNFYFLYFTFDEEFNVNLIDVPITCSSGALPTYSAPRAESIISLKRIQDVKTPYNQDYTKLKQNWHIPARNDFAIIVRDASNPDQRTNILHSMEKPIPPNKEVFARELTLTAIENPIQGIVNFKQIHILIKIW